MPHHPRRFSELVTPLGDWSIRWFTEGNLVRAVHGVGNGVWWCCDRKIPCSQCTRANKECGGYQDLNSLRIYDQSKEVAVKAQARNLVQSRSATTSPLPLIHEPISINEHATSHIFTYYVGTPEDRGLLSFLPDVLSTDPSCGLQAAMKAIGLSTMSRIHNLPDLRRLAGEEYGIALLSLNRALQNPVSAKADSTLATVTMLSMYEMVACQDMATWGSEIMDRWVNHVQGGMRLLELRGVEQLNSDTGAQLFTSIRMQNAISGVFFRHSIRNSPTIVAISEAARARADENALQVEFFHDILIQFNDLAAEVNNASLGNYTVENLGLYIGKALHLDANLRSWEMSLGPGWRYTTISEPRPPVGHPTHFSMRGDTHHTYHSVNVASMWNHYRQTRIVLHEMVRVMALHLLALQESPECQQTILQSVSISKQMVSDICASVRYHFISDEARFGGAVRLLWPLFIGADVEHIDDKTREWIINTLSMIGNGMGIRQALVMVRFLRNGHKKNLIPGT
ncbi:hypothetical protein N7490_009408 [Penicillium lividum]|nr:hypothetical protein N7490_009408 [Penicillium lividum]